MKAGNDTSILRRMLKILALVVVIMLAVAGIRLLLLLKDVTGYKQFWDAKAHAKPSENALTYIALGDSAAQGIGASSPMKGYVGLVAAELEKKHGQPVHIINLSVTGATAETAFKDQIPKLKDIPNLDTAIITLDIGANDINRNLKSSEEFEKDLDALFAALPKQTVLADLPSFARTRFWKAEERIKRNNPVLYKVAAKYDLKVAPLYDATAADKSLLANSSDIFHPSDRGYRNWASAFLKAL